MTQVIGKNVGLGLSTPKETKERKSVDKGFPFIGYLCKASRCGTWCPREEGRVYVGGFTPVLRYIKKDEWKLVTLCDFYEILTSIQAILHCNTHCEVDLLADSLAKRGFRSYDLATLRWKCRLAKWTAELPAAAQSRLSIPTSVPHAPRPLFQYVADGRRNSPREHQLLIDDVNGAGGR